MTWLLRGAIHLILYRLVYNRLVIDAADVTTVPQLVQYLLWPFLLYLRVSGQFHIIVGILHLFGFNLPETHHAYFLASSFTDFWRRINIYWKDFMMKLFYYPAYFRRKRGDPGAGRVHDPRVPRHLGAAPTSGSGFGDVAARLERCALLGLLALLVLVNPLRVEIRTAAIADRARQAGPTRSASRSGRSRCS